MFTETQEVIDAIHDLLTDNKGSLGLSAVKAAGDDLLFDLPAVIITEDGTAREIHGTNQYQLSFSIVLWVHHANLNTDHRVRNREDRELVTRITTLLHSNYNLGGNITFGHVVAETPGVLSRQSERVVVGTKMTWFGHVLTPIRLGS